MADRCGEDHPISVCVVFMPVLSPHLPCTFVECSYSGCVNKYTNLVHAVAPALAWNMFPMEKISGVPKWLHKFQLIRCPIDHKRRGWNNWKICLCVKKH